MQKRPPANSISPIYVHRSEENLSTHQGRIGKGHVGGPGLNLFECMISDYKLSPPPIPIPAERDIFPCLSVCLSHLTSFCLAQGQQPKNCTAVIWSYLPLLTSCVELPAAQTLPT